MTSPAAAWPRWLAGGSRQVCVNSFGTALALGMYRTHGLGATAIGWAAALVVLYPLCRWYLGVKRGHPRSVLRFL